MAITDLDSVVEDPASDHPTTPCNLCGDRHGRARDGRLGRYATTCDDCEARRGSHLVSTSLGYASRSVWRPSFPERRFSG